MMTSPVPPLAPPAAPRAAGPASPGAPSPEMLAAGGQTIVDGAGRGPTLLSGAENAPAPKAPLPLPSDNRTMLGVVAPHLVRASGGGVLATAPVAEGGPRAIALPSDNRTMLGVQSPVGPQGEPLPDIKFGPSAMQAPQAPSFQPGPAVPRAPRAAPAPAKGVRLVPLLLSLGALIAVAGLAALLLWRKPSSLVVALGAKPSGAETILLTCATCEDGTIATALGGEGTFAGGKVEIETRAPLKVGENPVEIRLRHAKSREEVLSASVPVYFRARPVLEQAFKSPPHLVVDFDAMPGAAVNVMDQPITFDATGRGHVDSPLASQATGPANEWVTIATDFRYVGKSGGHAVEGALPVKLKVVPLRLDAPGTHLATGQKSYFVSGQTAAGAQVLLDGSPIEVTPQGTFAREFDRIGHHELIASLAGVVPRTVPFDVRPLEALAKEGAACAAKAKPTLVKGEWIVVDGKRIQSRVENHATVVLLELTRGCTTGPGTTCRARVLQGREAPIAERVVGCARYVRDTASGEPELEAEWLEKAGPKGAQGMGF